MKQTLLPLLLLLLASCDSRPRPARPAAAPAQPKPLFETPSDYSRALENLPGSSYYFPVHVYNVGVTTVKKAFELQKDAYSAPTYQDGKRLSFSFDMTNPTDQVLRAPIPDYFRLQAACFYYGQGRRAPYTAYNRLAKTYEFAGSHLTTADGRELHNVPGAARAATAPYQLPFQPHQTRRFKVVFANPFPTDCDQVMLLGFTRSDQAPGEQVYVGMVLDVFTGRIIGQQFRKRNDAFVSSQ